MFQSTEDKPDGSTDKDQPPVASPNGNPQSTNVNSQVTEVFLGDFTCETPTSKDQPNPPICIPIGYRENCASIGTQTCDSDIVS